MTEPDLVRARLLAAIRADRTHLSTLEQRVAKARSAETWGPGAAELYVAALSLEHYYTAAESIFERIARTFEGLPQGRRRWHRELLDQMVLDFPSIRGPVLSATTARGLGELLSFRHFLRHGYAAELDHGKLHRLAADLPALHERLGVDLDALEHALGA